MLSEGTDNLQMKSLLVVNNKSMCSRCRGVTPLLYNAWVVTSDLMLVHGDRYLVFCVFGQKEVILGKTDTFST